jgi:2-polyprenyl-6-methoxyphenol hydroxylase-like FAD-dependent oxidoreductase
MDAEVLVVGGGPVGLGLAVELGLRGIRTVLVEQSARHAAQPRAKTTNIRSMEHMRRWGIAGRIRADAPLPPDYPTDVVFATRLFGHRLAKFENAFFGTRAPGTPRDERFAEPAQWIPQYRVEAALRSRAAELPGVTLRLGTRLTAIRQDAKGVEADLADLATGTATSLRAAYAIGADGARSAVREAIGARMEGRHAYAQHVNLVIRAPALREAMRHEPAIMYWLVNGDSAGFCGPMETGNAGGDLWFFMFALAPGKALPDLPALQRRLDLAFGREVGAEILVVDPWSAHSLIADRYRDRRILLAGDACHLHPPFGGYGMNLGIGDAVDLGWKLAAVLRGWGGPRLLDSYEAERRPVHRRVIEEAVANSTLLAKDLVTPLLEAAGPDGAAERQAVGARILAGKEREFRALGVVLGGRYDASPILPAEAAPPPPDEPIRHQPSAHPGSRAPHLWLADGRSLFDLFGPGFTLLVCAPAGTAPIEAAARAVGLPLAVAAPRDERLHALYGARLALIRPDGHVGWRGDAAPADPRALLDLLRGAAGLPASPRPA